MKIGIFGDSFAYTAAPHLINSPRSWINILANKLHAEVETHGQYCTSVFYSYKKFLEHYLKYDLIIFIVTNPTRYPGSLMIHNKKKHFAGMQDIEITLADKTLSNADRQEVENLRAYFLIQHGPYADTASSLMLKHIETLHDNVVFYPAFIDSFDETRYAESGIDPKYVLFSMWDHQRIKLGVSLENANRELSSICSHLIHEYNEFFGNVLYTKVTTGVWDFTGYEDIVINYPATYYWDIK